MYAATTAPPTAMSARSAWLSALTGDHVSSCHSPTPACQWARRSSSRVFLEYSHSFLVFQRRLSLRPKNIGDGLLLCSS